MDAPDDWSREQLERRMWEVDPRARLVPTRVLRRIIKQEQRVGALAFHLVHRRSLTIAPAAALRAVEETDLGLTPTEPLPDFLLLIECPDLPMPRAEALGWIWRRLFHASVHAIIDARIAEGLLDEREVRQRIEAIGRREFAEIRSVLEADAWLLTPRDEVSVYGEFVAVFLELRFFAASLVWSCFPGIDNLDAVAEVIDADVDGRALFDATRPAGAADPAPHPVEDGPREVAPPPDEVVARSEGRFRRLLARADRARSLGNVVRSAILRTRAARLAGMSRAGQARSGSADDVAALSRRLATALEDASVDAKGFRSALGSLLSRADRTIWSVEARLLYDLQSVCVDHERAIFQLDLKGWLVSLGRRPLKRPLPNQTLIRTSKNLRKAAGRLAKSEIDDASRKTLARWLDDAMHATEERLRTRFRPLVAGALEQADIRPANLPERVSFDRMIEELLDRVAERDYLTMGEVRDAIARSDLRQPDVAGPSDFARGDRVLRADRGLAISLDGVYHRGEIYLRALQRASLVMFGTRVGRLFVRFVAVPYGGAVGALITVQELLGFVRVKVEITNPWTIAGLGTILLLLLHSSRFFAFAKAVGSALWRGLRAILIEAPGWVLSRPVVRALLTSRAFDLTRRLVLQPLACAALTFVLADSRDHDRRVSAGLAALTFAVAAAFTGTPFGRDVEDVATDAALRSWRRLSVDLLPGLARFILDVFAAILEAMDRVIYAVDEKLRFRSGEGRGSLYAKAFLGAIWGIVTYVVHIFINLFVEPTVNPIKHFPTVTVAAKMLIPYLEPFAHKIAAGMVFLGPLLSNSFGWVSVFFLPGLAGFIVWELKENWKLFEANRPENLRPIMIGHHGETMRRLLLPGFHSGTIPRLFAKLRRAEREAYRTGHHAAARKVHHAIQHVEAPIRHFVERELGAILVESGRFSREEFALDHVRMATNRVEIVVSLANTEDRKLRLTFEDEDGRLLARVRDGGLRSSLDADRRGVLDAATAVMAARAGAEEFVPDPPIGGDHSSTATEDDALLPAATSAAKGRIAISWDRWVDYWSRYRDR